MRACVDKLRTLQEWGFEIIKPSRCYRHQLIHMISTSAFVGNEQSHTGSLGIGYREKCPHRVRLDPQSRTKAINFGFVRDEVEVQKLLPRNQGDDEMHT